MRHAARLGDHAYMAGRAGTAPSPPQAFAEPARTLPPPTPLHTPTRDAPTATQQVRRWFDDCLVEAQRGDVKQQALVSEMLKSGYGCEPDAAAAAKWAEKARARGYSMKGVYCELT